MSDAPAPRRPRAFRIDSGAVVNDAAAARPVTEVQNEPDYFEQEAERLASGADEAAVETAQAEAGELVDAVVEAAETMPGAGDAAEGTGEA